jgi:thioredoxin reductase
MQDLLIIGAGPAGVSAALWAHSLGIGVTLVDAAERIGGQLQRIYFHPAGIAGFDEGSGTVLAARYASQLQDAGVAVHCGLRAAGLECEDSAASITVQFADGSARRARTVLVATGLRRRSLEVPGEGKFEGTGVLASATRHIESLAKRDVIVVGGGDAGFENALILHEAGSRVTLLVRGEPHARPEFRRRVADAGIEVLDHTTVLEILGDDAVQGVKIERRGDVFTRETSAVVVKVGNLPNTEWCGDGVALDHEGYVRVGAALETSAAGVWAAGDVTRPSVPAIPIAAGQGVLAVAAIQVALRRP